MKKKRGRPKKEIVKTSDKPVQIQMAKRKERLLDCLVKCNGVISHACEMANVNRRLYYDYYQNDPDFRRDADKVEDIVFDKVEHKLFDLIEAGNAQVLLYYLKTKMKKRGYIEKTEMDLNISTQVIKFDFDNSDEEIKEIENE